MEIKNTGAPFDTSNWSDPALKVNIKFRFDEHDRMQDLFLEIINVTAYEKKLEGGKWINFRSTLIQSGIAKVSGKA
ncbi:hypothetical protein IV454_00045 [Massilia antarctica]|uniref:Uncharacterized protein n=1 Tax=Massilia antarctica TaxID=2765360 RepID=A0AA48WCX2_9BURK|nr:hypothetical protein [Massilia antarctica]QPI50078.1 hypothetical protein IV454_00045 [Massilia antarctica]